MNGKKLFDMIVEYAIGELDHDDEYPSFGPGMLYHAAVDSACKTIESEAARWDREVNISPKMRDEAIAYLSNTRGKRPYFDTWDGWKAKKWYVIKGQKAEAFNSNGEALFGYWQVVQRTRSTPSYRSYHEDAYWERSTRSKKVDRPAEREPDTVYYADGSGYVDFGGPAGPLWFDRNGES